MKERGAPQVTNPRPVRKLVILGGRGNGAVVASTVEDINDVHPTYRILGFVNDGDDEQLHGYPRLGPLDASTIAPFLADPDVDFFWSLVSVTLAARFQERLRALRIPLERFATLIHPTAVISKYATIGRGVAIQPLAHVGPGVTIGNHVHLFAQTMVGHDAVLDDFSYVANNACIGAGVVLREGAYVGTNATTLEHIELGAWSLVGMGSVVLRSVPPATKVVGSPARPIGER